MNRAAKALAASADANFPKPDRRPTTQWLEEEAFRLPGSLRSDRLRVDMSPWLRLPFDFCDDPEVRRLTVIGPIQSGKSTLGEGFIGRAMATDPGNLLYSWEDEVKAEQIWNERIEKTIRQARQIRHRLPPPTVKQRRMEIQFRDGFYLRIQGVNAAKSRQSRSVRYLVNEEMKDWKPGAREDLGNRVAAAWNSFELDISPGGIVGDETHRAWRASSQHVHHIRCPECGELQVPRFRTEKGRPGGLFFCDPESEEELAKCKPEGEYDYNQIAAHCYYECEHCAHRIHDTPTARRKLAETGEYVCMNPGASTRHKGAWWHSIVVPWVPWVTLISKFHNAVTAMRYGDIEPMKEFVQKREAEFWSDDMELETESTVSVSSGIRKSREGLGDHAQFRFMACDKQRGSPRDGEAPHYWVVIRDWKPGQTALLFEGKVQTDEELEALREDHGVEPFLVSIDSGDGMTAIDVYRLCAKCGYVALKGEDKAAYTHVLSTGEKVRRRYSPEQVAYATGENGEQIPISLVLYSKQGIRDALHYLRNAPDFDYQTPEDISDDYRKHQDAEQLVDWHIPRTGQKIKVWKQVRKRNDLFVCECYQALFADLAELIGMVPVEDRPKEVKAEHPARG